MEVYSFWINYQYGVMSNCDKLKLHYNCVYIDLPYMRSERVVYGTKSTRLIKYHDFISLQEDCFYLPQVDIVKLLLSYMLCRKKTPISSPPVNECLSHFIA
jgi:hypothetical protein